MLLRQRGLAKVLLRERDWAEMAYLQLKVKSYCENFEKLGMSFGAFKRGKPANMAPASNVEYHPGALKYYTEAGIKIGG